jgi:hypothetical protein
MWESRLSGSERGWRSTMVRMKYRGTVGKPDGNRENKPHPKATGASSLLEGDLALSANCERTATERRGRSGKLSREELVPHSEAQRPEGREPEGRGASAAR